MSVFTADEQTYLDSQLLGRLATIASDGAPQARPVAFLYNRDYDTIDIGGHNLVASRKYRNIQADPRVSFVIDDLASTTPAYSPGAWTPTRTDRPTPATSPPGRRAHQLAARACFESPACPAAPGTHARGVAEMP